jgi:DNA-binding NarL/FixJ family response regulator
MRVALHGDEDAIPRLAAILDRAGIATTTDDDATVRVLATALTAGFERDSDVSARLILCSPPAGARAVRKALETGVDGIVWDAQAEARLVVTVQAVAAGQIVVPREAWRPSEEQELTNREKQVLALIVMGLSNGEIAGKLYLTESTVKSHLSSAFRKLGVRSRAEAARVIADPTGGLGTGILAITPTSSSGRSARRSGE